PIAFGIGACDLRSDFPPLTDASDRKRPPGGSTGTVGDRPSLSRFPGPGFGTEQLRDYRGSEAGSSADFGFDLCTVPLSLVGDNALVGEWGDELVAVATEQGLPFWGPWGTICRGWAKAKHGDVAEGISLLRNGLAAYHATGAELWMPPFITLLARTC